MGKPTAAWASAVLSTAAIANHSARAILTDKITGVAGVNVTLGGQLDYVEVQVFPTATAAVPATGGLIELNNNSYDWTPCQFYTNKAAMLTATGITLRPMRIYIKKWIPDNSRIVAYYTAHNAATDMITITFHWILEAGKPARETFMNTAVGAAITQVTTALAHLTFTAIPTTRGGTARAFMAVAVGAPETIVCEGGHCALKCTSADWSPTEYVTPSFTGKTEVAGDTEMKALEMNHPLPGNSIVTVDFTPVDNQSQFLIGTLIWEA